MRRIGKWIGVAAGALVLLAVLAAAGGYAVLRNTVPSPSGRLAIAGLSAPVEVVRDGEGVPHIFAGSTDDLFTAFGFVHAQDRLWQMELQRRAGQGRLSEMFGEATYTTDVFLRTLDLYGHAERSIAALPPAARAMLEAYARGVNAFMQRPTGIAEPRYPPELLLLRHTPEPWRPADSLVSVKMMALQLSTNLNHEMLRLALAAQGLGSADIEDLMPPGAGDAPPPLPEMAQLYPLQRDGTRRQAALAPAEIAALDDLTSGGASNNWVVSGARSKTGKTLLANDPHLRLGAPSVWYLAHLALTRPGQPAVNMVGASLAGTPLIVLGRGDSIAWGFTNTGADVQDVFVEKVNPANPGEYLTPEGWRPFTSEPMAIKVKGAGVRNLERRRTRHGPVLPGFYRGIEGMLGPGHVAALQWTALSDDDATIAAGLLDPDMRTVQAYMQRMRAYVVPMQSMVVADDTGAIGLIAPGRVPVRDPANRMAGRAPVPGWDATYDWKGFIPFDQLPRVVDPPEGAIGTANAKIVGPDYPHLLTFDWDPAFRMQRVKELILDGGPHDLASMRAAQADVLSPAYARLKPLLIAAARRAGGAHARVLDQLAAWDATMRPDIAEPLILNAWVRETVRGIYKDDLGPAFERFFATRAAVLLRLLEGRATGRDWCDDRTSPVRETCDDVIGAALQAALADLETRFGADRGRWRWGPAHYAAGEHRPFGTFPLLASVFNVEVPSPGGTYTLNRGEIDLASEQPYANRAASSYRAVYDFADLDRSLYIHTTGQSGNAFSPFYRSFAERWARVEYIEIATRRDAIARSAIGTWMLAPR